MEQFADLVTKFENVMIAGGSLFALWGVYNLLEEKTKGRPGHGTEWWQVLAGVFIAGCGFSHIISQLFNGILG